MLDFWRAFLQELLSVELESQVLKDGDQKKKFVFYCANDLAARYIRVALRDALK